MTFRCCARVCESDENTTVNGDQIKFYRFPADKKLQQQWESICKIFDGKDKNQNIRLLCELHFDKSCFNSGNQLKPDAIPKDNKMKRTADHAELETNKFVNHKLIEISSAIVKQNSNNKDSNNKHFFKNNLKQQESYRLTIQIDKIYLRPCPKSKKINQIKINIGKSQSTNNKDGILNKTLLEQHNALDEKIEAPHQCMICKTTFTVISELYIHLKKHLICDICKTESTSKKLHQKHCKLHESKIKQFPYKCHVCELLFETKEAISKHNHITLDKYDDITGENRIQYCKACNMTFRNKSIYRNHLNSHVEKVAVSQLTEHTVTQLVPTVPAVGHLRPVIFSCRVCSKNFASIAEIDKHTRNHMKELKFNCND